jgi:hypothetical protein
MPSGKKDIYGVKSKALYKVGDAAAEMAVKRNADASAKVIKTTVREGTTNIGGGRPAVKMQAKIAATKPVQKPVQVTRITTDMKSSPATKKR